MARTLEALQREAQASATRSGRALAVLNFGTAGAPVHVIRDVPSPEMVERNPAGWLVSTHDPETDLPPWRVEFPHYPLEAMPSEVAGWHDASWRNDACPNFHVGGLSVFIDHPDADERDEPDSARFTVYRCDLIDGGWCHPARWWESIVYHGDDWAQVLGAIAYADLLGMRCEAMAEWVRESADMETAALEAFAMVMGREAFPRWGAETPSAGAILEDAICSHDGFIIAHVLALAGFAPS